MVQGDGARRAGLIGRLMLLIGGLGAVITLPIMITGAIVAVLVSSLAIGSCDFNIGAIDRGTDRGDCAGSSSPLVRASIEAGHRTIDRQLAGKVDPNRADDRGNLALSCAAMVGNESAVAALLTAGASPTASGATGGPPIVAAASGEGRVGNEPATSSSATFSALDDPARVAIVQLLAAHGASPTAALAAAAEKGSAHVVRALLDAGAKPNGDPSLPSPLVSAVFGDHKEVVTLLLDRGADVNSGGRVPLLQAGAALLSAASLVTTPTGARVSISIPTDVTDPGEVPPLVAAVVQGHLVGGRGILTDLLAAGPELDRPAYGRYSALWVAASLRNYAAAMVLRHAGAKADPPGLASATAVARADGDATMLAILSG